MRTLLHFAGCFLCAPGHGEVFSFSSILSDPKKADTDGIYNQKKVYMGGDIKGAQPPGEGWVDNRRRRVCTKRGEIEVFV